MKVFDRLDATLKLPQDEAMLAIYRLGSHIPTPGVDPVAAGGPPEAPLEAQAERRQVDLGEIGFERFRIEIRSGRECV